MATKYEDQWNRMASKHKDQQARMAEEVDTTLWEVFSETSSIDLVRLLPWCLSTATNPGTLPTCYMGEALATTVQWRANSPSATTTALSKGSQWAALCTKLRLHLFPFFQCQTFPLEAVCSKSGIHSLQVPCWSPAHKVGLLLPSVHPMINLVIGSLLKLHRLMSAVGAALHMVQGGGAPETSP